MEYYGNVIAKNTAENPAAVTGELSMPTFTITGGIKYPHWAEAVTYTLTIHRAGSVGEWRGAVFYEGKWLSIGEGFVQARRSDALREIAFRAFQARFLDANLAEPS